VGRVSHVFFHAAVAPLCPAKITQVVDAAEMPMIATDSATAWHALPRPDQMASIHAAID